MNKIQVGDKVRINKPEDMDEWPFWVEGMERDSVTVPAILAYGDNLYFGLDGRSYNLKWCTKVEDAEMTLDKWSKMTPQERLEWNRSAFEALVSGEVEWLDNCGEWCLTEVVDLSSPHRPAKKPVKFSPPKEVWVVVDKNGQHVSSPVCDEETAQEDLSGMRGNEETRVVKYVLAE